MRLPDKGSPGCENIQTLEEKDDGRSAAASEMRGIVAIVARLEHSSECTGDEDCELSSEEILAGLQLAIGSGKNGTASEEDRERYHDEDDISTTISEDPLSVQFRSDWHSPGEEAEDTEYEILLSTGGPATRIIGTLDKGIPDRAILQHQNWGTPWTQYFTLDENESRALLTYAQQIIY